jgi:hypothetical protein
MSARVEWVDALRGFALFFMIFAHLINVLSVHSIYTDAPFYSKEFDSPFPYIPIPPILFTFVAGMSVFLSLKKRGMNFEGVSHIFKRYGFYLLLSSVFTTLIFGLDIFLKWEEAIEGVAVNAMAFSLLLFFPDAVIFAVGAALAVFNPFFWYHCDSLWCMPLYGGFFSIANLLPFMIAGYFFFKKDIDGRWGLVLVAAALVLHFWGGYRISYFMRTPDHKLFTIGLAMVFAYVVRLFPLKSLQKFGALSVLPYFLHFVLLYKPLEYLKPRLPDLWAVPLAFALTTGVYYLSGLIVGFLKDNKFLGIYWLNRKSSGKND